MKEEKKELEVVTTQVAETEVQEEELKDVNGGTVIVNTNIWSYL